jgi:hypothetical protein
MRSRPLGADVLWHVLWDARQLHEPNEQLGWSVHGWCVQPDVQHRLRELRWNGQQRLRESPQHPGVLRQLLHELFRRHAELLHVAGAPDVSDDVLTLDVRAPAA